MEYFCGLDNVAFPGVDFFRIGIDFLDLTFIIFGAFRLFGSRTITADFVLGFSSRNFQAEFVYRVIRDFTLESCLELLKGFLQGICFFGRIRDLVGGFYWRVHQESFRFWNLFLRSIRDFLFWILFGVARSKASVCGICFPETFCVQVFGFDLLRTITEF